jgi:superfamily II DNA helicase RecQ
MDQIHFSGFRTFLYRLEVAQQLDRIVLDEAHLILTASSYRPYLEETKWLRQLHCQIIYLTATLPPIMQQIFQKRLLLQEPALIRSIIYKKDIRIEMHQKSKRVKEDFLS